MKGSNIRRWGAALAVVIIAGAAYWFWHDRGTSGSGAPAAGQGPQGPGGARHGRFGAALAPVQAATATEEAVPRYLTGLGTVTAANTVTVRSRVDGQLLSLHFQEGQQVKAGDLLAQIDPSQFKVALAQAQGQLAKDQATLANARRDLARYQQLVKTNLVSRQELDTQQSLVVESAGTVKADEAAVASAQLQLDWTRITAPIDGRVGLKQVDIGNQISSGDTTGIVVLTQTHPIDVVFTLPESSIATVVIPAAALQMGNEGHFVWVLNDENKVSKHSVTPGIQDSQKVVISAGLSAGDRVVTDGIDRLTEGAKVEVVTASSGEQAQPAPRQSGKHGARS
ncbi:TPA: MdtA/MuxA family multidrug efflux RND transporter periplasmic adaptor subunit [Klebsiella pneumoniae]